MPLPFARGHVPDLSGPEFAAELRTASELWFACGYRPGITAYLHFFLLHDFITLHDRASASRFATFRSMAQSFYETDLFVRDVTDSGPKATGGISALRVRELLTGIMARHRALSIPLWMMTYFGFSLVEAVERQCAPLPDTQRARHLRYMATAFRIMGIPFAGDRAQMEAFARAVEQQHARALAPQAERHARRILLLGEMVGVSSHPDSILPLLPDAPRRRFTPIATTVRPGCALRTLARAAGRLLIRRAVGRPRIAVPQSAGA